MIKKAHSVWTRVPLWTLPLQFKVWDNIDIDFFVYRAAKLSIAEEAWTIEKMENIDNYVETLCDQYNIRVELSLENLILYGYKNVTWGRGVQKYRLSSGLWPNSHE